ncbi:XdhC family protein [Halalkalibacter krulwichiae]|uniref:Putative xanthine dehydrogenase subunit A n=1 Tax=Halalkalibacter krulwichiae TaxID=199441 RepID=A0A1X9M662_9BACI|nr:XdhC family protein [Halalkalibacter krulwichiae]ARK28935.1 putative xanthine dehydrogenase subunit A [Halalkalibacter krulwichiae]
MREFYHYLQILKKRKENSGVIATVVKVEGSAYRHEGAKMLFFEDGTQYGLISGGCLEEDLSFHSEEVLHSCEPKIVTYDLRVEDDLGWGLGAGCNGKVTILMEPIRWNNLLATVLEELEQGHTVVSIRKLSNEEDRFQAFYSSNGKWLGNSLQRESVSLKATVLDFISSEQVLMEQNKIDSVSHFLFERLESKEKLYIFGAGPDVEPLVKRAAEFDFCPIVIDPREDRCHSKYFSDAALLVCEHPETFIAKNQIEFDSYIVIITHSFTRDQQLLHHFIHHRPKYLGILGPKRRTERLLHPEKVPSWLHSPIGVDIYAEGADEISISILAQLIKVRNQKRNRKDRRTIQSTAV